MFVQKGAWRSWAPAFHSSLLDLIPCNRNTISFLSVQILCLPARGRYSSLSATLFLLSAMQESSRGCSTLSSIEPLKMAFTIFSPLFPQSFSPLLSSFSLKKKVQWSLQAPFWRSLKLLQLSEIFWHFLLLTGGFMRLCLILPLPFRYLLCVTPLILWNQWFIICEFTICYDPSRY